MDAPNKDLIDKSSWPRGEWDNEPDNLGWVDEETGLYCKIKRNMKLGNLCGYVTVPNLNGICDDDYCDHLDIQVHGGITFSMKKDGGHVFGFDCAHSGDLLPVVKMNYIMLERIWGKDFRSNDTYKNIEYVKHECKELAKQLKDLFNDK